MSIKRFDCTDGGAQFCAGCYTMTEDSLGDYVKFEDHDALQARVSAALKVLDTIDDEGDDHYYGIADRARMILRGECLAPERAGKQDSSAAPESRNTQHPSPQVTPDGGNRQNCGLCGQPRADHAEVAPDGKPECRMKENSHHE